MNDISKRLFEIGEPYAAGYFEDPERSYFYPQAVFYEICETLTKDGYKFVTLSDLFKVYGVKELPYDLPIIDAQLTNI